MPPERVPGLEDATAKQFSWARISPSGDGLHWDDLDVDVSLTGLIGDVLNLREWAPRNMKWAILTAIATVASPVGDKTAAQEPPLAARADQTAVSVAALEWFGDLLSSGGATRTTLVVSPITSGLASSLTAQGTVSLSQGQRLSLAFTSSTLDRLSRRSGLAIETCVTSHQLDPLILTTLIHPPRDCP
jgi:hypothetical protein